MDTMIAMEGVMNVTLPVNLSVLPRWQRNALVKTPRSSKTPSSSRNKTPKYSADRFIPSRAAMNFEYSHYKMTRGRSDRENEAGVGETARYKQTLAANLIGETLESKTCRVLSFRDKPPTPSCQQERSSVRVLYSYNKDQKLLEKPNRHIPSSPSRILDAPEIRDDYYLNLVSWSRNNILAVALGQTVYLWRADTGTIEELAACTISDDYVTSVSWIEEGGASHLAVGTHNAEVQIWDAVATKQLRSMRGHTARVGSLAWNSHLLSSGSRDSSIMQHDVRVQRHHTATFSGHHQEVCGLAWSPDLNTLASGGNDNLLCLWDNKMSSSSSSSSSSFSSSFGNAQQKQPLFTLTNHQAAVKAIAWCPWERNLLASGGGTADRTIKFWNSTTGSVVKSIDTGSQVCGLIWSHTDREILSSHGFSRNELCLWKYPTMTKIKELTGHTARVLHIAMSPDGSTVASAAADETLRFWNVFAPSKDSKKADLTRNKLTSIMGIR